MNVVVIGGGLSGLSSALALSQAGVEVTLIERSPRLGGRACSVPHKRLGIEIDLGQHAILGCCTSLIDFYRRIGALDCLEFHDSLAFAGKSGFEHLKLSALPQPLHLLPSFLRSGSLTFKDKLNAWHLLTSVHCHALPPDPPYPVSFDSRDPYFVPLSKGDHRGSRPSKSTPHHVLEPDISAAEWLARLGQSKSAIAGFWEPVLVGALNERLDRASARYAALVVRLAMLGSRDGFKMGVHTKPLSEAHHRRAKRALEEYGVTIHLNEEAVSASNSNGTFQIATRAGRQYAATHVVIGGAQIAAGLFPPNTFLTSSGLTPEMCPEQVPIVTLYLWLNDLISLPKVLCMPQGNFHWCFDRTAFVSDVQAKGSDLFFRAAGEEWDLTPSDGISSFQPNAGSPVSGPIHHSSLITHRFPGTALSLVWSAAREAARLSQSEITAIGVNELEQVLGRKLPKVDSSLVVRVAAATFSPFVGSDLVRPVPRTRIDSLYVAGDWSDTGWPGTMESAVRSGYASAAEILMHNPLSPGGRGSG
jgi:zeta-carotene desaturase